MDELSLDDVLLDEGDLDDALYEFNDIGLSLRIAALRGIRFRLVFRSADPEASRPKS